MIAAARGQGAGVRSIAAAIRDMASVGSDDSIIAIPPLIARWATRMPRSHRGRRRSGLARILGDKVGLGPERSPRSDDGVSQVTKRSATGCPDAAANALGSIASCDAARSIELEPAANALVLLLYDLNNDVRALVIEALASLVHASWSSRRRRSLRPWKMNPSRSEQRPSLL